MGHKGCWETGEDCRGGVRVVSPYCRCTKPPQSMCRNAVLILPLACQPSLTTHHIQRTKTFPTRTHTKKKEDSPGTKEVRLELPSQVAGMKMKGGACLVVHLSSKDVLSLTDNGITDFFP